MKTCSNCKQSFLPENMRRSYCKWCKSELEKIRNPDRREWNKQNKDKNKQYSLKYFQNQRQDPLRKFQWTCNIGISRALTQGWYNDKQMKEWVGLTAIELKKYIQSQWVEGMNWDNYGYGEGKWVIDHKMPIASAQNKKEVEKLNHHSNLQPMWWRENLIKGAK